MSNYGYGAVQNLSLSNSMYIGIQSNTTSTPIWNISITTTTWMISLILLIIYVFGLILEILSALLFFYHFIKRTKYFSTGFFRILTLGYVTDMISMLVLIFATLSNSTLAGIGILFFWYSTLLLGPWNTLMALNRFTAVCFWKTHEKFWKGSMLKGAIFAMFLYPFLVNIHLLFQNPYCIIHSLDYKCSATTRETQLINMISNGIHVIIGGILGVATVAASRLKLVTVNAERKKFELFLLIQSFASIIIFGINLYYFLSKKHIFVYNFGYTFNNMIEVLSNCYYVYFRISSTLILFFLSKAVRQSFINFYGLNNFCRPTRKEMHRVSAGKVTVSSATSKTSISTIKIT